MSKDDSNVSNLNYCDYIFVIFYRSARHAGNQDIVAAVYNNLGLVYLDMKDTNEAHEMFNNAMSELSLATNGNPMHHMYYDAIADNLRKTV